MWSLKNGTMEKQFMHINEPDSSISINISRRLKAAGVARQIAFSEQSKQLAGIEHCFIP